MRSIEPGISRFPDAHCASEIWSFGPSRNDDSWVGPDQNRSHPKQPRIARLDLFRHFLDSGGIFLHQLDVGNLPASRLRLHLRMNRILRREIDEELLGLARMQPRLE